jgi:hypothetical protein
MPFGSVASAKKTKVFCFFFSKKKYFLRALQDEPSAPGGVTNHPGGGLGAFGVELPPGEERNRQAFLDDMRRSP